jgi:membrane-associated phospholipid phosphatase
VFPRPIQSRGLREIKPIYEYLFGKIRLTALFLLVILTCGGSLHVGDAGCEETASQTTAIPSMDKIPDPGKVELDREYFKGYFTDTAHILSSPLRWDKTDWFTAAAIVGVAAGLYAYDSDIQVWSQKNRNDTTDRIAKIFTPFGNGLYTVPALGLFYAYGYAADDSKARKTALLGIESFIVSSAFTGVLKFATHRYRPSDGGRYDQWDGPSFSGSNISFPSEHTSSAFAIATILANEYNDNIFVGALSYSVATMVALSRINDNEHWASDVFIGAAIGYFTAKTITALHKPKKNILIIPGTDGKGASLSLAIRY